jgi:hypothetical protein
MPGWMMLLAHRVPVIGMRVPSQSPTAMDVAVVPSEKEIERADKRRHKRDVRERSADEVVTALRGPVDQVMEVRADEHLASLRFPSGDTPACPDTAGSSEMSD